MTMIITLVRHGETDWNAAGRIQGHEDIALNAAGLAQAQALAERLAVEPITRVYCSDLVRTRQTVAPLLEQRQLPVIYDRQLRERHFGRLQGMRRSDIETTDPDAFELMSRRDLHASFGDGESLQQFYDRCVRVLSRIVTTEQTGHLLLICHGGVLDCLYRFVHGQALDSARQAGLSNAAINQIQVQADGVTLSLVCWDDTSHLSSSRDETDRA